MTITRDDLAQLQDLERRAVDLLSVPLRPDARAKLQKALDELRAAKRCLLGSAAILRKAGTEPHPKDAPNAPHPDGMLGTTAEPLHFRAPPHLRDLVLHLRTGHTMRVPASGVVEVNAGNHEVHQALRDEGFVELHGVDRFGKSDSADITQLFRRDRLTPMVPPFVAGPQHGGEIP